MESWILKDITERMGKHTSISITPIMETLKHILMSHMSTVSNLIQMGI